MPQAIMTTTVKIPKLSDYGIDSKTGFLPANPNPIRRLSGTYFEPWESLLDDLSHHLVAWKLRSKIVKLPVLDASNLNGEREYERAFLVLSLLSHAYIWGAKGEKVIDTLPKCLADPWIKVSLHLGLRPISCHAALVYYNYKLLDPSGPYDLSNLATLHTISGGIDESWFYLITVAIEADGAPALQAMIDCINSVVEDGVDFSRLTKSLHVISDCIDRMTKTLMRMPENCDPYIFYHRVRIYFAGWSNMKDLPNGLTYEGDQNQIEQMFLSEGLLDAVPPGFDVNLIGQSKKYPGGSAAQSSLIHALDVFLGVEHRPTKSSDQNSETDNNNNNINNIKKPQQPVNFLKDMRCHMPQKYRQFLNDLQKAPSVKQFLLQHQNDESNSPVVEGLKDAKEAWNSCIGRLKVFRDKHIQIVARYVVIQARRAQEVGQEAIEGTGYHGMGPSALKVIRLSADESPSKSDSLVTNDGLGPAASQPLLPPSAAVVDSNNVIVGMKGPATDSLGTGGTDIMPFLKQSRDETFAAVIPK